MKNSEYAMNDSDDPQYQNLPRTIKYHTIIGTKYQRAKAEK